MLFCNANRPQIVNYVSTREVFHLKTFILFIGFVLRHFLEDENPYDDNNSLNFTAIGNIGGLSNMYVTFSMGGCDNGKFEYFKRIECWIKTSLFWNPGVRGFKKF